ncbi:hypothetical protein ACGFX2_20140 [Streptomyces goshikiensis]|uniref:hypothetical protein n=1 Tax=Streptomyces goshikiensis TaxID=1942 RepID=UPI00371A337B
MGSSGDRGRRAPRRAACAAAVALPAPDDPGNAAVSSGGGLDARGNLTDEAGGFDGGGIAAFVLTGAISDTLIPLRRRLPHRSAQLGDRNCAGTAPGGIFNDANTVSSISAPVVDDYPPSRAPSVVPGCVN